MSQTKQLSKIIVITVLPPERKVKYDACAKASSGIVSAQILIRLVAVALTVAPVLYRFGIKPEHKKNKTETTELTKTEKAISLKLASFASFSSLAPNI